MTADSAPQKFLLPGTILEMTPDVLAIYGTEIHTANPDMRSKTYRALLDAAKTLRFAFDVDGQRLWFESNGHSPDAPEPTFSNGDELLVLERIRAELGDRFRLVLRS